MSIKKAAAASLDGHLLASEMSSPTITDAVASLVKDRERADKDMATNHRRLESRLSGVHCLSFCLCHIWALCNLGARASA